jgi:hypothetical protein
VCVCVCAYIITWASKGRISSIDVFGICSYCRAICAVLSLRYYIEGQVIRTTIEHFPADCITWLDQVACAVIEL